MRKISIIIAVTTISLGSVFLGYSTTSNQPSKTISVTDIKDVNIGEPQIYLKIYRIDGCQYIGRVNDTDKDFLVHKANCDNHNIKDSCINK